MSKAEELATKTVEMASEGPLIHLLSWADIQGILQETAAELRRLAALEKAIMDAEPVAEYVMRSDAKGKTNGICFMKPAGYSLQVGSHPLYTLNGIKL